jgi:hypothetical protein
MYLARGCRPVEEQAEDFIKTFSKKGYLKPDFRTGGSARYSRGVRSRQRDAASLPRRVAIFG